MLKLVDTPSCSIQDKEASVTEGEAPKLKLVVSNLSPIEEAFPPFLLARPAQAFSAEVRPVPFKDDPLILYQMTIHDPSHYLECDLLLEVEEGIEDGEETTMTCHFPLIDSAPLNDLVMKDDTLYALIMIQFQMKILEKLLLFCATHCASRLTIYMDDAQAEEFGVYQSFLIRQDQTLTMHGEKTVMVMSADQEAFDAWIDFMDKTSQDFRQTLWKDQKENPVIQVYLKSDPQLKFF